MKHFAVARDPSLRENQRCGVCGRIETLTKAHVPPKAAGNSGSDVVRSHFVRVEGDPDIQVRDSRPVQGGMWVWGHCAGCNGIASKYDPEYARMSRAMVHGHAVGRFYFPPPIDVSPGAVARSVLMGMLALAPHMREVEVRLADQLANDDHLIALPATCRLYLARTFGNRGRVSGPVGWFMPLLPSSPSGNHWGATVAAQIWFTPLAWALSVPDPMNSFINHLRWADVTDWVAHPVEHRELLSRLVPPLPIVAHPNDTPSLADEAIELFNDEVTHYLRCDMREDIEARLRR